MIYYNVTMLGTSNRDYDDNDNYDEHVCYKYKSKKKKETYVVN